MSACVVDWCDTVDRLAAYESGEVHKTTDNKYIVKRFLSTLDIKMSSTCWVIFRKSQRLSELMRNQVLGAINMQF